MSKSKNINDLSSNGIFGLANLYFNHPNSIEVFADKKAHLLKTAKPDTRY